MRGGDTVLFLYINVSLGLKAAGHYENESIH